MDSVDAPSLDVLAEFRDQLEGWALVDIGKDRLISYAPIPIVDTKLERLGQHVLVSDTRELEFYAIHGHWPEQECSTEFRN